jgi:tetratricopeptide (TPR) repeat protein
LKHKALLVVLAFALVAPGALPGQSLPNENWLLFEQGNSAAARKEYGLALQLYKEAVLKAGIFPEAEVAIGDIFVEEGEVGLADAQYEKAYNIRSAFYIPDKQYDVLLKLANLYENQGLYKKMEDRLTTIIQDDKRFTETLTSRLRTQVEKNYFEKGLDRVIELYSYSDVVFAPAHSNLGFFYYRTGRYSQSASHLLYATIYRVGFIDRYLAEKDSDYQYSTLGDLISLIGKSPDLARYALDSNVFRDLYYLACSTYSLGYPERAANIWKTLTSVPIVGTYQAQSQKQLKSPFTEPLLNPAR